jgi:tRNA dimethylallyltransferase
MASPGKLIVIVGTTAAGKSAAAMHIAQEYNGEIICADSRTVYKGMDIGTAKPSVEDQATVPHHLLDIVEPNQPFTAAQFQKLANQAIADIQSRGKLPIMVGGTGLYVDSILYNYDFKPANPDLRDEQNPRHLKASGQPVQQQLRADTLVLGVDCPTDALKARIKARVDAMVDQGLAAEVEALAAKYGWEAEAMKGIGYREWQAYFASPRKPEDLIKTKELIVKNTWQYARRQRTWFRRNKNIHWDSPGEQPSATIEG